MKFSFLRLRAAMPAIASIALLSPACAQAPSAAPAFTQAPAAPSRAHAVPSRLDYLVFASLADSSRLPALTQDREPLTVGQPPD